MRDATAGWRRYLEGPVVVALLLGFSSGLPLALTGATLTFWLAEAQVDTTTIGLFALVGVAYGWKYLWSPAIDRLPLPLLTRLLGRRRGWLVLTQLCLIAALAMLGGGDPREGLGAMAFWAVVVAFCSASQDIVVDAYRAESVAAGQEGVAAGAYVIGYRVALLVASAGALYLATAFGWRATYWAMAALVVVGLATTLAWHEPEGSAEAVAGTRHDLGGWLRQAVAEPFAEFFARNGAATAVAVLCFILLYKLGDTLLGAMTSPFYVEAGFTKTEVANVAKLFGFAATVAGGFLGGLVVDRRGVLQGLWICGIAQMASNLIFVAQAWIGHSVAMLAVTITVEQVAGGMGTTAFVAYLMSLCDLRYTATQYALLSSAMAQARTTLSAGSGYLAVWLGWPGFFLATTVAAVPGLALLWWLQRRGAQRELAPA